MKISGFTIARNVIRYNYPAVESIQSILPICDEFIINAGDSDDETLKLFQSIGSPKVRIIQTRWDMSRGKTVLSEQTNAALRECQGDWAFYLQSDEVIHEEDLPRLKRLMLDHLHETEVDAFRFKWMHFYGSYCRYRIDYGWFQKQDRIVRNNGQVLSEGDAWGFERSDGRPIRRKNTGCLLYHYGWVQPGDVMTRRRVNAEQIGFGSVKEGERDQEYRYGDLTRFPAYFGSHPSVMKGRVAQHALTRDDFQEVRRRYWWHPLRIIKKRYKTSRRVKARIE